MNDSEFQTLVESVSPLAGKPGPLPSPDALCVLAFDLEQRYDLSRVRALTAGMTVEKSPAVEKPKAKKKRRRRSPAKKTSGDELTPFQKQIAEFEARQRAEKKG